MLNGEGAAAQAVPNSGITRTLTQTRDVSALEMRKVLRAVSRRRPPDHRDEVHTVLSMMAALGLAFAAAAIVDFMIDGMRAGIEFPQKGLVGFLIGGSALIAIFIRRSKVGNTTQTWVRAGNRYVLGEGGLAVTIQGVSSFYPWSCVRDLRFSDHHLLLYVSNKDTIVLPKAAFVDQDVAGFCTELEKLWRQSGRNAPSRDVLPDPSQNIGPITEMPEQSGEGVLELRQVRELTAREQRNFMRLLRKHNARGNANKWYTAVSVAWWIVALWFALSVVAAFDALRPAAPALAWQLAMTAIACCALLFGIGKVNDFIRAKHLRRRDLGGAFLIEADGLRTKSSFGEFKGFWRSIPIMVESDQYLFVMLNDTIGSIIVKSAFDGQDVAAFCMEAQKRWQAGRTAPA